MNLKLADILKTYNWRDSYYDLYPGYSKPMKEDAECMFEDKDTAIADAEDLLDMVKGFPDPLPVYRVIGVKQIKDVDLDNPGWSWSWEKESAIGFAGGNGIPKPWALLRGYAPKSKVHWLETLKLYHEYSGAGVGDSENEIRIPGNEVKDVKAKLL
jgi:hypothetical protein